VYILISITNASISTEYFHTREEARGQMFDELLDAGVYEGVYEPDDLPDEYRNIEEYEGEFFGWTEYSAYVSTDKRDYNWLIEEVPKEV